jgi:hypothetical protein
MSDDEGSPWGSSFTNFYGIGYHVIGVYYARTKGSENGLIYTRYTRYTDDH